MNDQRTYPEKLRDPRWQKIRLKVFERDGWACASCGATTITLNVHHKCYERGKDPWEYSLDALLTVCEDCHKKESPVRPHLEQKLLTELKRAGYLVSDLTDLTEEAISRRIGDFQRALLAFFITFELVFGNDWEYTRLILQSQNLEHYIQSGRSFGGVLDEL